MRSTHRLHGFLLATAFTATIPAAAQIAINSTGAQPAGNAMLDLRDLSKGLLIPRMNNAQRATMTSAAGFATTSNALLIYQTDSLNGQPAGYYFFDNLAPVGWKHVPLGVRVWTQAGNAGTDPSTDFVGTVTGSTQALEFRISGTAVAARLNPTGEFQVQSGAVTPVTERMEVTGALLLGGTPAGTNAGTLRYSGAGTVASPGVFDGYIANPPSGPTGWRAMQNQFGIRKAQDYPIPPLGCDAPTNSAFTAAAVTQTPRQWPIIGTASFTIGATTETPYSAYWEDSRHQYLYKWSDLAAAGICDGPANPITAVAFQAVTAGVWNLHYIHVSMKNTTAIGIVSIDVTPGLQLCHESGDPFSCAGQ